MRLSHTPRTDATPLSTNLTRTVVVGYAFAVGLIKICALLMCLLIAVHAAAAANIKPHLPTCAASVFDCPSTLAASTPSDARTEIAFTNSHHSASFLAHRQATVTVALPKVAKPSKDKTVTAKTSTAKTDKAASGTSSTAKAKARAEKNKKDSSAETAKDSAAKTVSNKTSSATSAAAKSASKSATSKTSPPKSSLSKSPKPSSSSTAKAEDVRARAISEAVAPLNTEALSKLRWLPMLKSRVQFDAFARTYNPDILHPLPHVLFVIDRKDKNKVYYVNVNLYSLHEQFVNSMYLSLERGSTFWRNNHLQDNRRFICGRIAYQSHIKKFAFEFWEGDTINAEQLAMTYKRLNRTFYAPLAFKPNSAQQEVTAERVAAMPRLLPKDVEAKTVTYQALNIAAGIGRLRVIENPDDAMEANSGEIVVLSEPAISLPPVAGIIVAHRATPLSHVNLLAKSFGIPNAYIQNAVEKLRPFNSQLVSFQTKPDGYELRPATPEEIRAHAERRAARRRTMSPRFSLNFKKPVDLAEQTSADVVEVGAKSANLGEVINAQIPNISVPRGFTVPFYFYVEFMRDNKLDTALTQMLADERFGRDAAYRRQQLELWRKRIQNGEVNRQLQNLLRQRIVKDYAATGLFVRSSSNAEDLPNFNGAGLYDTVPNVRGHLALVEAMKKVWASLWNYEAYEARERTGIDHTKVMMAVIIQEGINAEAAGVMVTTDPFDVANNDSIYINAKRGLGIRVVSGKRIAEQLIYDVRTRSVNVLTRSNEDSLLTFDDKGGVREVPINGTRIVLKDEIVARLATVAAHIKTRFNNVDQDIEWATVGDQIYILQTRPFIHEKTLAANL